MPSDETARIQECHITIGHVICGLVEQMYFVEVEQRP
jgi:D-sedoheptulose 7-phosphate isomerase